MMYSVSHPLYVFSEDGTESSRVIGFETAEADRITEVFTEYGSVPPSADLTGALLSVAVEVAR